MLNETNKKEVKEIAKQRGTTIASLVNALVTWGLENGDPFSLAVEPQKKRGRPRTKTAESVDAVEAQVLDDEGVTDYPVYPPVPEWDDEETQVSV